MKKYKKNLGMSLMEVVIAIAIFVIGITGFTELFLRSWKSNNFIMTVGQSSQQASQGMDEIVSSIRKIRDPGTTGAVDSIADNDLVVFLDYDEDTTIERIHLYLSNGQIIRGIREPDTSGNYATGDQSTKVIVKNVVNAASEPVFSYYDQTNAPTTDSSMTTLVKVFLRVNVNPLKVDSDVTLKSYAKMRNITK